MTVTLADIAEFVKGRLTGDGGTVIRGFASVRQAVEGDLTFARDKKYLRLAEESPASGVITGLDVDLATCVKPVIRVANPYESFVWVVVRYHKGPPPHPVGVDATAKIEPGAVLGNGVTLGAHAYIGAGAELGDRVVIYPNAYVGAECYIGEDTVIYPNAVIREQTKVGARCIIHSGVVLGSDGFGFVLSDGTQNKIPQLGVVEIGDDVEIGANSAVDRGTFGYTRVGNGTKIDNLVQIGHNAEIGKHCVICGNVGVAGSAIVGDYVTLAAGCGVTGHIEIGDHVTVAGMSGVTKSVAPQKMVSGFPAIDHAEERRIKASMRWLPDMVKRLSNMEKRLEELESTSHAGKTKDDSRRG